MKTLFEELKTFCKNKGLEEREASYLLGLFTKHNAALDQPLVSGSICSDSSVMIPENDNPIQPDSPSHNPAPHRCPICEGTGIVHGSFYTTLPGCGGTSSNVAEQCRQCEGKGIIYC